MATKPPGIGWSRDGIDRYNELHDLVTEDRISKGIVFNNELLNVFMERRRVQSNKRTRSAAAIKAHVYPKDDLALSADAHYKVDF
jgi:hypothetical protein